MLVGRRITGKGTSFYAMLTIRTRSRMSRSLSIPNWVRAFPSIFGFVLFWFEVIPPLSFALRICVVVHEGLHHGFGTQGN